MDATPKGSTKLLPDLSPKVYTKTKPTSSLPRTTVGCIHPESVVGVLSHALFVDSSYHYGEDLVIFQIDIC